MKNPQYAGFWIRSAAVLIDVAIMIVVLYIPLTFIYGMNYWTEPKLISGFWDILLNYIVPTVATIWFWLRFFGTPGKMLLKLKIVDAKSGGKLTFWQAVGRYFAYIPAILPMFFGLIWIAFDDKKQGWHDKLAGTVVIRG